MNSRSVYLEGVRRPFSTDEAASIMSAPQHDSLPVHGRPLTHWAAALQSDDAATRDEASAVLRDLARALGAVVPLLSEAVAAGCPAARLQAVQVLRDLGVQFQPVGSLLRAALKEAASTGADEAVRAEAAAALEHHLEPQAHSQVPALVEAMLDELASVRASAAAALAELGPTARPATAALIRAAARDGDRLVRVQAAVALWRIDRRDRLAVPVLIDGLAAGDDYARWLAADCLREIGPDGQEAAPALLAVLADPNLSAMTRQGLRLALERIDPIAARGLPR